VGRSAIAAWIVRSAVALPGSLRYGLAWYVLACRSVFLMLDTPSCMSTLPKERMTSCPGLTIPRHRLFRIAHSGSGSVSIRTPIGTRHPADGRSDRQYTV